MSVLEPDAQDTPVPPLAYEVVPPMTAKAKPFEKWPSTQWEEIPIGLKKNQKSQQVRVCRICQEGENDAAEDGSDVDLEAASEKSNRYLRPNRNPLIHPCRCSGTMAFVHVECINHWRTKDRKSYYQCETCRYQYNLFRPRLAALFENTFFLHSLAITISLVLIIGLSYLAKVVDVYALHHPETDSPEWRELHGETFLWIDRIYLFAGLIFVAFLGLIYLLLLCVTQGSLSGAFCCCAGCNYYGYGGGGFCDCGSDGGFIVLFFFVILMLMFGLFGALAAVYTAIEQMVAKMLDNIKVKILEVPLY
ncbi:hypothetical protein BC938DRAFT_473045 [Jimgerdemannia flammicorona]|uniref:RING-CH-type domain-containing protein n=1 Tax=Jimgerdemannia flammicorona TaxID=994334 RepID=A0A433Q4T3_9FUNG|nr:hypothetical protein BC938DRAFT_473045 [Jimgerdemannia flammicorona]